MNTNNNEKTVFLESSNDWEAWSLQFQAQAVAGDTWAQIQGLTPFLNKPTAPNLALHKHKAPSQTAATTTTTTTRASQTTPTARASTQSVAGDDPEEGSSNTPVTTIDSTPVVTIADLTADGLRTY